MTGADAILRVFARDGAPVYQLAHDDTPRDRVVAVAWHPRLPLLATTTLHPFAVHLWDVPTRTRLWSRPLGAPAWQIAFAADATRLVVAPSMVGAPRAVG